MRLAQAPWLCTRSLVAKGLYAYDQLIVRCLLRKQLIFFIRGYRLSLYGAIISDTRFSKVLLSVSFSAKLRSKSILYQSVASES